MCGVDVVVSPGGDDKYRCVRRLYGMMGTSERQQSCGMFFFFILAGRGEVFALQRVIGLSDACLLAWPRACGMYVVQQ